MQVFYIYYIPSQMYYIVTYKLHIDFNSECFVLLLQTTPGLVISQDFIVVCT